MDPVNISYQNISEASKSAPFAEPFKIRLVDPFGSYPPRKGGAGSRHPGIAFSIALKILPQTQALYWRPLLLGWRSSFLFSWRPSLLKVGGHRY